MDQYHHSRIDAGQPKAAYERTAVVETPQSTKYTPEQRQNAIEDALEALKHGETTNEIAQRHNIPGRTLRSWLITHPEADQARAVMIGNELSRSLEDMRTATAPLPLAPARNA